MNIRRLVKKWKRTLKTFKREMVYRFWRSFYIVEGIYYNLMPLKRILWFYQRGRRGYSDRDLWAFDYYLADVIGRGVADLRKTIGIPPQGLTKEEWDKALAEISYGFLNYLKESENIDPKYVDYQKRMKKAKKKLEKSLNLFSVYFLNLWN